MSALKSCILWWILNWNCHQQNVHKEPPFCFHLAPFIFIHHLNFNPVFKHEKHNIRKTYDFLAAFFIHLFTHIFLAQIKHFHLDIICTLMKQFCGQCNLKTILTIGHVILQIMWASKNRWYELFHNPSTIFHFLKQPL